MQLILFIESYFSSEPRLFLFMCNSRLTQQSAIKYLCQVWLTMSKKTNLCVYIAKGKGKCIWKRTLF